MSARSENRRRLARKCAAAADAAVDPCNRPRVLTLTPIDCREHRLASPISPKVSNGRAHSGLCFPQFAFSTDARIRFFQILDAIFELALVLWEPLSHLVGSAWYIPTGCGVEGHDVANLEFV